MNINDILQVVILTGILFFILGYKARSLLLKQNYSIRRFFLSPKYLKPEGYLFGDKPAKPMKNTDAK